MALSFYTTHTGPLFVAPGGQSERGSEVAAAGNAWTAVNIADGHGWDDWAETIRQDRAAGMRVAVWGRVENSSVEYLMAQGKQHQVATILNIEDEFKTTSPAAFEKQIKAARLKYPSTREVVLNTVGWLYNDLDFTPIAHRPVQLQVLVRDMGITPDQLAQKVADCFWQARHKGFTDISVCFQTYGGAQPSWYSFWGTKPRVWVWGDDIGAAQAWPQWAPK